MCSLADVKIAFDRIEYFFFFIHSSLSSSFFVYLFFSLYSLSLSPLVFLSLSNEVKSSSSSPSHHHNNSSNSDLFSSLSHRTHLFSLWKGFLWWWWMIDDDMMWHVPWDHMGVVMVHAFMISLFFFVFSFLVMISFTSADSQLTR